MDQPSSGSTNLENKQIKDSTPGRNGDAGRIDSNDPANQRMVADRLLAALASGNLEHLAQARQAFIKSPGDQKKESQREPLQSTAPVATSVPRRSPAEDTADLAAALERRSAPRTVEHAFVAVDELRKEEEELRKAEAELERRRAEVQAAKKKAEDDAKHRAFEESRRQLEAETQKKAEEEKQRLATLQTVRDQAEAATRARAKTQRELNAAIDALRIAEQRRAQTDRRYRRTNC